MTADAPRIEKTPAYPNSYRQILSSTVIIASSSIVSIGLGAIRGKCIAILLGPAGTGLFGLYNSILDLSVAVADLGIQGSGVRQIAEASSSRDEQRIARAVTVLRHTSILLGLIGGLLLAATSTPVASLTFGDTGKSGGVALLGLAVFLRLVSGGQSALLQGRRRIGNLALLGIFGAASSTIISVPVVYFFGTAGIVPSILAMALVSTAASWWFAKRIGLGSVAMTMSQKLEETGALLRLGAAFLASSVLTLGAAYAIRMLVLRYAGVEATGLYQAAWTLGGLYAGFILQAMGADFYPRLTAVASDNAQCNVLVNEQAEVGMLLAAPGVIATLTLAPLIMTIFYSAEFSDAATSLRWICLGMSLRVVSWPIGYIVIAKGHQNLFLFMEVVSTVVYVLLAWLLIKFNGLEGAGQAFFGLYLWHTSLSYTIARNVYGFRFSLTNRSFGTFVFALAALVFCAFAVFPIWSATLIGAVAMCLCGAYSVRKLIPILRAGPSFPTGGLRTILTR